MFGNGYGTDRAHVESLWRAGKDVLLEIDVQGAAQVRAATRRPARSSSCRLRWIR